MARAPVTAEDLAALQTDVLAGYVFAQAARCCSTWTARGARPGKWSWLAGRDRHSARKTKMPQIRNQGSQRYACHFRARRSAWAAALITPAWTSSPLAVRTRP